MSRFNKYQPQRDQNSSLEELMLALVEFYNEMAFQQSLISSEDSWLIASSEVDAGVQKEKSVRDDIQIVQLNLIYVKTY